MPNKSKVKQRKRASRSIAAAIAEGRHVAPTVPNRVPKRAANFKPLASLFHRKV